jgi:hypothetical protein
MSRSRFWTLAATATLVPLAACDLTPTESNVIDPQLASAFSTAPAGFAEVNSSFSADGGGPMPFLPGRAGPIGMMGGPRGGRGPMSGGPMGGGLGPEFLGGIAAERGGHRGPFGAARDSGSCTFANGQVTCTNTRGGIVVTSVHVFRKADGTVQERPDSTTDYHKVDRTATGTIGRIEGVSATVNHRSTRTVTGLTGEQRTVTGSSHGEENASGTRRDGREFTARRIATDNIDVPLVIPNRQGRDTYPVAGKITRTMEVTITTDGQTRSSSRTEVITYNGSATATVVITQDGTTKTCTMPLPRGRIDCGSN